jgi:hypothetical protein
MLPNPFALSGRLKSQQFRYGYSGLAGDEIQADRGDTERPYALGSCSTMSRSMAARVLGSTAINR